VALRPIPAQQSASDLDGWTVAKWGMTANQIVGRFPDAEAITPPERNFDELRKFVMHDVQISNLKMEVYFEFGTETDTLRAVTLTSLERQPQLVNAVFQRLQQLLSEKYGAYKKQDEALNLIRVWNFRSGDITLRLLGGGSVNLTSLRYRQKSPNKKGLEKL
jgi:hypothetical protein